MSTKPANQVEVFANPNLERAYLVKIECPEFTCLCPLTGQPDFAQVLLEYIPDESCVELKSLKLYLWSFRDKGAFHEAVTNEIADHLMGQIKPRYLKLNMIFATRGGIDTGITVEHGERRLGSI